MTVYATTDLCDAHEAALIDGSIGVMTPGYLWFGALTSFAGPAATLQVFEDNALVRSLLEQPGAGRVLVIDGGASLRSALVGGKLATEGVKQGWAGIIVHGCVRDASEIDACAIGVCALGLNPRRSSKRGAGQLDVPLQFSGVTVRPGDWIYADRDGILVSAQALHG